MIRWYGRKVTKSVSDHIRKNLTKAALLVERAAKTNVSDGGVSGLHVRTGTLRRSITHELSDDGLVARIGTNLKYALIHELGGVIRPVHAQFLHFEIDGHHVMTKRVVIPMRPYLRPAIDRNRWQIKALLSAPIKP